MVVLRGVCKVGAPHQTRCAGPGLEPPAGVRAKRNTGFLLLGEGSARIAVADGGEDFVADCTGDMGEVVNGLVGVEDR